MTDSAMASIAEWHEEAGLRLAARAVDSPVSDHLSAAAVHHFTVAAALKARLPKGRK